MAARKKATKKVKNGGRRPNSGRKPVEAHFDALHLRLNALEDGVTTLLKYIVPATETKATLVPKAETNGESTQAELSLYSGEPSGTPGLSTN